MSVVFIGGGLLLTLAIPYLATEPPLWQYLNLLPWWWVCILLSFVAPIPLCFAITWVLGAGKREAFLVGKCRECHYDRRGNEYGVCPECGSHAGTIWTSPDLVDTKNRRV